MKKIITLLLLCAFAIVLVGCSENQHAQDPTPAPKGEPIDGLMQAFTDAGFPIIDRIDYTPETDPNRFLGEPGQYVAKTNFNDARFFGPDEIPLLTVEHFANTEDMQKRHDYMQLLIDNADTGSLKNYIYGNKNFLLRLSFDAPPEAAAEYERVFNNYLNN